MLWPDPAQRGRLVEVRDNLLARIAETEREGWFGEHDVPQPRRTGDGQRGRARKATARLLRVTRDEGDGNWSR